MNKDKHTCCICGKEFEGYDNNPWPIDKDEKHCCCGQCNQDVVIPARINMMYGKGDLA